MRRNYFIDKEFQTKFLASFLVLLVIQMVLLGSAFMVLSSKTLTTGYSHSKFIIDRTSDFFLAGFLVLSAIIAVITVIAGVGVFIFLSHRIAGPLYRFEAVLKEMAGGQVGQKVRLRESDQLVKLQDALNEALESVNEQVKRIKDDLENAHAIAKSKDMENRMKDLEVAIARAKENIGFFKTS